MMRRPQQSLSDVAQTLHEIIKESPGIHFRSLGREAGLSSVGQLRHHLDTLRRRGAIVELEDGRFKRFFVAGEHDPRLREGLSRFARRVPRRIAKLLLSRPMNRTEIRRSLSCADSTLGYHLNRMVEMGDLQRARGRNCCVYSLKDPDFVRDMLQRHPAPSTNGNSAIKVVRGTRLSSNGHSQNDLDPVSNGPSGPKPPERNGDQNPLNATQPDDTQDQALPGPHPGGTSASEGAQDRSDASQTTSSGARQPARRERLGKQDKKESDGDRDLKDQGDTPEVPSWLLFG